MLFRSKKFEKVNQSNIFLYHVIEKMIFYKFIIFWRIPKSSKMNSDFPPTANAQPSKKAYSLYLWPRSKCWIRASRASIQHAATKVTNIGNKLSSKASPLLRKSELPKSAKHSLLYDGTVLVILWISFSRLFFQDIHQDLSYIGFFVF